MNQPCVIAYTGEIGDENPVDGITTRSGVKLQAYANSNRTSFLLNGSYLGPLDKGIRDDKHLYYDSHDGYDYSTNGTEAPVFAASSGETITGDKCRGTVALKHSSGYTVYYRHLSFFDKKITDSKGKYKPGVRVEAGDPIGKAGGIPCKETDPQLAVHLHFEVRNKDSVQVDPYGWEGDLVVGKADPQKENKGVVNLNLWGRCSTDPTQFSGAYFAKQMPVGAPVLIRCDSAINFDWGTGSPDPDPVPKLPSDHFSVRWTKIENFKKGTYTFTVGADDGVRLKIDGTTLIDDWNDHAYRETSKPITFKKPGEHLIEVEYYEKESGARVEVRWGSAGNPPPSCSFTVSPSSQSFGASAGSGSVAVTTQAGCSWTAVSSASWLTITSGSSGSGNGTVGFSVAANPGTSQRQATITVQGQVFTVTQTPPLVPDLVVTQVAGPSCGGIGGTGQFTATVLNQGNGFASATSTGFYLSTDSTVNTSDLLLGSCGTSSLNPNQSTQCSAILTIPNTPGTYFIGAIANDSNAGVIESNTGNNALAGGQITVSGNCPGALGTILVQANLNGNPITLTSGSFTLIGPRETLNWTGGIPATFNEKAAGTWTISNITNGPANSSLSSIDPSSTQVLSGGASITFTLNFTGTFLPDLQILDLNPPPGQQAVIGSQASLSGIRVQNFGPAPTGVPFSVGLYWSADTIFSISNDVFAGSCTFPALQSNQQGYVDPCVISVPSSLNPGAYYIVGFVDYNQQVAETNESNNVKVQTQWPINLIR